MRHSSPHPPATRRELKLAMQQLDLAHDAINAALRSAVENGLDLSAAGLGLFAKAKAKLDSASDCLLLIEQDHVPWADFISMS